MEATDVEKLVEGVKRRYHYRLYMDGLANEDGGAGSGNWGHAGRKGLRGGSAGGNSSSKSGGSVSNGKLAGSNAGGKSNKGSGHVSEAERRSNSPKDTELPLASKPTEVVQTSLGKFGGASPREACDALRSAKATRPDKDRFRVTDYGTAEDFMEEHPDAICHVSAGGSTCAVTPDGDIVAVCKKRGDHTTTGEDLLALAVAAGGKKLDSYDGNHEFYNSHGFVPVSWCKWYDGAADEGWLNKDWREANGLPEDITTEQLQAIPDSQLKYKREDVVFYKYVGPQCPTISLEEFKATVPASDDYDAAKDARNNSL